MRLAITAAHTPLELLCHTCYQTWILLVSHECTPTDLCPQCGRSAAYRSEPSRSHVTRVALVLSLDGHFVVADARNVTIAVAEPHTT
jgi:predicted RNA-binding Zn-ribbon protein involved in translation (DUF1610 family)